MSDLMKEEISITMTVEEWWVLRAMEDMFDFSSCYDSSNDDRGAHAFQDVMSKFSNMLRTTTEPTREYEMKKRKKEQDNGYERISIEEYEKEIGRKVDWNGDE